MMCPSLLEGKGARHVIEQANGDRRSWQLPPAPMSDLHDGGPTLGNGAVLGSLPRPPEQVGPSREGQEAVRDVRNPRVDGDRRDRVRSRVGANGADVRKDVELGECPRPE